MSTTSLGLELGNVDSQDSSLPPPPTSPVDSRSHSTPSRSISRGDIQSSSRKNSEQQSRRRDLKPLSVISNSQDGPNIFVTSESPISAGSTGRPCSEVSLNEREEKEEDTWAAWRRTSESSTIAPSSSSTRRPSHVPTAIEGLRPPSPQLRTKPFRPGLANRQSERQASASGSTDSFDAHVRQSVEVKFTRGLNPGFDAPSFDDEGSDGEVEDQDAIYLNSPALKKAQLVPMREAGVTEILSPVPQYGWKTKIDGWSTYAPSHAAPSPNQEDAFVAPEADHRADGRQFYRDTFGGKQRAAVHSAGRAVKLDDAVARKKEDHFVKLRSAVEKANKEDAKDATATGDTIGRALCVFAVVLLVKILIK